MGKCIIIAASDFDQKVLIKENDDFLIVADAGYNNFKKITNLDNKDINLLIGDFDSLNEIPSDVNIRKLNPIKDDTDVLDAIKYALDLGYKEFELYGCVGGRIEHSLANISALAFINSNGGHGKIINGNQVIELLGEEIIEFDEKSKGYISIFAFSEKAKISIYNMKYNLIEQEISNDFPLGIDNEFIGKQSKIEVHSGKVLIIYYL